MLGPKKNQACNNFGKIRGQKYFGLEIFGKKVMVKKLLGQTKS